MSRQLSEGPSPVRVRRYVGMFVAFHLPLAFAVGQIVLALNPKPWPGLGGLLIYASATFVGWRFALKQKRLLLKEEMWRLIAGCIAYLIPFEAFGIWGSPDRIANVSKNVLIGGVAIGFCLDLLFLWLSFRFGVRRNMERILAKTVSSPA
jgi:hypothetical protein